MVRAEFFVGLDCIEDDLQQRHEAGLAAFAGDPQRGGPRRQVVRAEAERLGDTQATAIEQRQHGGVAGGDPWFFLQLRARGDEIERLPVGQRLRQGFRLFRRADRAGGCGIHQTLAFEITKK